MESEKNEKNVDSSPPTPATISNNESNHLSGDMSNEPSTNNPADEPVDRKSTENEPDATDPEEVKPPEIDGGYGWVCVVAVFLINAHTWGINSVRPRIPLERQILGC